MISTIIQNKENQSKQYEQQFQSKQSQLKNSQLSNKSLNNSKYTTNKNAHCQSPTFVKKTRNQNIKQNSNRQTIKQNINQFGFNMTIDYQNAKYQGKLTNKQIDKSNQKIIKAGLGILIDDELNFLVSNWKNDFLCGKTLLINRLKNYLYGHWSPSTKNPSGAVFMKIDSCLIVTKFNKITGKWSMTQAQKNVIVVYDIPRNNLIVLTGMIEESLKGYKCSKAYPLTVVEFAHFDGHQRIQTFNDDSNIKNSRRKKKQKEQNKIKAFLEVYCKKYEIQIDEDYFLSLPEFLQEISNQSITKCANSKNFALNVSKKLLSDVNSLNQHVRSGDIYQSKKNKIFQKNCIIFKELSSKSNTNDKIQVSKQPCTYFGFLGGLGIKFVNLEKYQLKSGQQHRFTQNQSSKVLTTSIRLKSIGVHNLTNYKIEEIGCRFYDNKCVQQGNFKTKSTVTYQDLLFRPSNKLVSIYNKYHKQETHFVNEYFDKNSLSIFKLLSYFSDFMEEHVHYIINECYLQTTKFQQKQEKSQLVTSLLTLKNKITKIDNLQNDIKQSKLQAKNPIGYQILIQSKKKNRSKSRTKNTQGKKQIFEDLKSKNNQLKEKIKKVKYQIQYEAPSIDQNIIFVEDDKMISKIKKHLIQTNHNINKSRTNKSITAQKINDRSASKFTNKSASKSLSKSQVNYRPKQKRNYIELKKILTQNNIGINQDSLQIIDSFKTKKVNLPQKNKRQKTEGQKLLSKINGNIGFKQKFNYGIEYHKNNESFRDKFKNTPEKNKYNGRERLFTDNQLDNELQNSAFSAVQIPIRSITPGIKSRKKEQYRHYIYSNVKRNIENEEEKYENQKENQQRIRAELMGLTLNQYRERFKQQAKYQTFVDQKVLEIINLEQEASRISKRNELNSKMDANQTFGVNNELEIPQSSRTKRDKSLSLGVKQRIMAQKMFDKYLKDDQRIINPIIYTPLPKQESLTERRLRILQQYKKLNEKQDKFLGSNLSQSGINIHATLQNLTGNSPYFKENCQLTRKSPAQKLRIETSIKKIPIYEQKLKQKVLSPLRLVKDDISTIQGYPLRSAYICLKSVKGEIKNDVIESVRLESSIKQRLSKGPRTDDLSSTSSINKSTRKYQYYF